MSKNLIQKDEEILQHIRLSTLSLDFEDPEIQQLFEKIQRARWPNHTESMAGLALLIIMLIYIPYYDAEKSVSIWNLVIQVVLFVVSIAFVLKPFHSFKIKRYIMSIQTIHFFLFFIFHIIPSITPERIDEDSHQYLSTRNSVICTNTGISLIIVMMLIQSLVYTWFERAAILWTISFCDQFKSEIYKNPHFIIQMMILLLLYTLIIYMQEKYKRQKFFITYWQNNLLSEWKDIWKNTIPTPIIIVGMRKQQSSQQQNQNVCSKTSAFNKRCHKGENMVNQTETLIENPKEKDNTTQPYPQIQEDNQFNLIQVSTQNHQQTTIRPKNITLNEQLLEINDLKFVNGTENQIEDIAQGEQNKFSRRENIDQLLESNKNNVKVQAVESIQKQKQNLSEECKKADSVVMKGESDIAMDTNQIQLKINSVFVDRKEDDNLRDIRENIEIEQINKDNEQINLNTPFYEHHSPQSMNFKAHPFFQFKDANKQFYSAFSLDEKSPNSHCQNNLKIIMSEIKDINNTSLYNIIQEILNNTGPEPQRRTPNAFKSQVIKTYNHLVYKDKYFEAKLIECDWDDKDRTVMIILNDITEKVVNEQKEQQYQYKDQILAIATHDLKTPLNNIVCSVDSLKVRKDNKNITEQLDLVTVSVNQMMNVIRDILDYSALNKGSLRLNIETFRLSHLIEQIFQLFKLHAISRNVELKYIIDPILQTQDIISDPSRLVQIFNNLIANSLKFTSKGHILIKFKSKYLDQNIIHISIKDTGVGIPKQYVDQIFKPFQTFNHTSGLKTQGVGLGLIICKTLVRLLGPSQQRIGLKTQEKIGSKICFDFYRNINEKIQTSPKRKSTAISDNETKNHLLTSNREKKFTIYSSPQKQSCEALLLGQNTDRSQQGINWVNKPGKIQLTEIKINKNQDELVQDIDAKNSQKDVNTPIKRITQLKLNDKQDSSCVIRDYLEQEPVVQSVKIKQPISSMNLFTQISLPSQGDFGIHNPSDAQILSSQKHIQQKVRTDQSENPSSLNFDYLKTHPKQNQFTFIHTSNNNIEQPSTQVNTSHNHSCNFQSQFRLPSIQNIQPPQEKMQLEYPITHEVSNKNEDLGYFTKAYQNQEQGQSYIKSQYGIDQNQKKQINKQYPLTPQHSINQKKKNHLQQNTQSPLINNNINQYPQTNIASQNNINSQSNLTQTIFNQSTPHENNLNSNSPLNSNNEIGNSSPYNQQAFSAQIQQQGHGTLISNQMSKFYVNQTPQNQNKNLINSTQSFSQQSTPQRGKFKAATMNITSSSSNHNTQNGTFSSMINQNILSSATTNSTLKFKQTASIINSNPSNQNINKHQQLNQNYVTPVVGEVNEEVNDSIQNSQKLLQQIQQKPLVINILVVDDEYIHFVIFEQLLKNLTQNYYFQFDYASNGLDALNLIQNKPNSYYEIAFVDGCMPIMDGFQFIENIKTKERKNLQLQNKLYLVGISGGGDKDRSQFISAGADHYIQKPVQTALLQDCIQAFFLTKQQQSSQQPQQK